MEKTKKYVAITNNGTTPREFLKVIGAGGKTDKADDNSIFSQFKSGYKIASIIALRRGLCVIASSTDDEGRYALEYKVWPKTVSHNGNKIIIPKICYWHYDGKKSWIEESSFSLDAFPKWAEAIDDDKNNLYPILRELIANARDEDKDFKYETDIEMLKLAAPGKTVVYLEQTDDVLRILGADSGQYFKFFGQLPIYEASGIGGIYAKSVFGETRLFNCGYLISCQKDKPALHISSFDYDILGKDFISEEKVLRDKDRWKYDDGLARLFLSIRDRSLLISIIDAALDYSSYELGIIRHINSIGDFSPDFAALCREIWLMKFGPNAILSSDEADNNKEAENLFSNKIINLPDSLKNFFKKAGIENADQKIVSFSQGLTDRPPNAREQEKINRVKAIYLDHFEYYRKLAEKYPVTVLMDASGSVVGVALDYNRCGITEGKFAKSDTEFLLTWVHELRHCVSKLQDAKDYRGLMQWADGEIVALLKSAVESKEEARLLKEMIKKLEERIQQMEAAKNKTPAG